MKNIKSKYLHKTKKIIKEGYDDHEVIHSELDDLLCELLNELGFGELVELFENEIKWYS